METVDRCGSDFVTEQRVLFLLPVPIAGLWFMFALVCRGHTGPAQHPSINPQSPLQHPSNLQPPTFNTLSSIT